MCFVAWVDQIGIELHSEVRVCVIFVALLSLSCFGHSSMSFGLLVVHVLYLNFYENAFYRLI